MGHSAPTERTARFLDVAGKTHRPQAKQAVLQKQFDTIKREMERAGSWRPHARLLDVGCGVGMYAEYWHSRGLQVTGVDVDANLIREAKARAGASPIRYEVETGDRLPFSDGAFEIVFANSLLEHVSDWERHLKEWIRVLAPGGVLWIETTNVLCPRQGEFRWLPVYSWWPGFMKRLAVKLSLGPLPGLANYSPCPALHWFSFFQLRAFLQARGLSVRDRFDCVDPASIGLAKRWVRRLALANSAGRWAAYLLVSPLVVLAMKPVLVEHVGTHAI